MTRLACAVLVVASLSATAHADDLGATRAMPLAEIAHTVDIKLENGIATYTVRRQFKNSGETPDQVELVIGLPYGAAATGLRIKAKDRWYTGELMEREAAAKLYEEMTGLGAYRPKDPALLAWMWADTLSLQVFPVMPGTVSTVEYTLTAPTRYMGGRYVVSYPRVAKQADGARTLPLATPVVTVHFGWGDPRTRIAIDGIEVGRDRAVALVPPPHQDWEELIDVDRSASYVASKLVVPSSSHTDKELKKIKLALDIRHTYRSDLRVELLTPQNQRVDVFGGAGGGANDLRGTYPIDVPAGTTGAGTWRLLVSDHAGLDTGTLDRWSITFGDGVDRTVAAAADTPLFIPDAPSNASEAGIAAISSEPPPMDLFTARLGKVVASKQHAFSRLELDMAPQLVPTPKRAQVVFVIDTSYSMEEQGVEAQLALVAAYASHVPDAEIEVVTFRRHADRVFGRFIPVRELDAALDVARRSGKLALGNGSNLDEGALLASQLLAPRTAGPRRVVLATDELVKTSLTNQIALAALNALPADTVVHVIVPGVDNDDRPHLQRRDDATFAALATKHHGIFADLGGFPVKTVKDLAPTVLELVRPTRIEDAKVTGFDLDSPFLHEGDGVRLMIDTAEQPAPERVTLTGRMWSDPVSREIAVTRAFSVATAAFVFGSDEHQSLSPEEQMTVAMMGHAVSPVTSFVAAEPGTRPSPIGLARGYGTIGSGRYGTIGHGYGAGMGMGWPAIDWASIVDASGCMASEKPSAPWTISLSLETTRMEIVDVTANTPGSMARCLAETAWKVKLDRDRFTDLHETYTFELSGPPATE
jgi:subtilisin-like proprotein convertase family protein